jgi:tRNA pseudouridine55 synthase
MSEPLASPPPRKAHGILNCFKPSGWTSRDLVNRAARLLKPAKVGHAGTLDPLAEGVLVLAVGSASRLVPMLHLYPKCYRASFQLGCSSPSDDVETEVTAEPTPARPSLDALQNAAGQLTGTIWQVPPRYSAIKVAGRRAYEAARRSEPINLAPRRVVVQRFEITSYEFPHVTVEIECGTGTYVRTLGVDLARAVGTAAVMTQLTRTSVGPFTLSAAHRIDQAPAHVPDEALQPLATATGMLPQVHLDADQLKEIEHGRKIDCRHAPPPGPDGQWAGLDPTGQLRAILVRRGDLWGPKRVFPDLRDHR